MDREKVIKGLEACRKTDCANCEYSTEVCLIDEIISDALVLLKEHEAVVRCKDCKHYPNGSGTKWTPCREIIVPPFWFCADGERAE